MKKIDEEIYTIDKVIFRHMENINLDNRGVISQDICTNLRNLVEYIMLKFYAESINKDLEVDWHNITKGIEFVKERGDLKILKEFHDCLQITVSHYTPAEEKSERLMLKYYEYLLRIKKLLKDKFNIEILDNLNKFPLNIDKTLYKYYEKIAEKIENHRKLNDGKVDRYYIQKIKPFFVGDEIYYEVTFNPANDYISKFDRNIAFTKLDIIDNYAVNLKLEKDTINILGKNMPIFIITDWKVSIRKCEYANFSKMIIGEKKNPTEIEEYGLSNYLTTKRSNLLELVLLKDKSYEDEKQKIIRDRKHTNFFDVLDKCRNIIKQNKPGENILRYLLYTMNNKVIKKQRDILPNPKLSNLYLSNGSIPFDNMPFINSLRGHNPKIKYLYASIPYENRENELLARLIKNNTEIKGKLFTSISEIDNLKKEEIDSLINEYNSLLWYGHEENSKIVNEYGQVFINGYKVNLCYIIKEIKRLAENGRKGYDNYANEWLKNTPIDCEEKMEVLSKIFKESRVALIYGAAGTGKTTLINYIAKVFKDKKKLFLAQTNPAIDNLKRQVSDSNCEFITMTKFIKSSNVTVNYDIIIIDECSTISNKDMYDFLKKASYDVLVLVGDSYQIESIRFGNWFSILKSFVSKESIFELKNTYRSKNKPLLKLWNSVRKMDSTILETLSKQNYSKNISESIFEKISEDEIILCLNYDGLYGINNINRFMQENNPYKEVEWGIQKFKVNDPILFNESDRFKGIIYNNMKGKIIRIEILNKETEDECISFDIELDRKINKDSIKEIDLELLDDIDDKKSTIRFFVKKQSNLDEDDEGLDSVIPFQVSYAISIHKAQGLEYDSVKIVITNEVDELISHNIFYTAITRAKENLKIYWSPEVEKEILSRIEPINNNKDKGLIRKYL